jgi:hypothetical protein
MSDFMDRTKEKKENIDMRQLNVLLRAIGEMTEISGETERLRRSVSKDAHEIAERNNLAEKHGDVEIHAPMKNTLVVIDTGEGRYQIDTHTVAKIVNSEAAEAFFKKLRISPSLVHEVVPTVTKIEQLVKKKDNRARDWLNSMIEEGIVQMEVQRRITALGRKRPMKIKRGQK